MKISPKKEFFLEESLETLSSGKLESLEMPISRRAFGLLFVLILAVAAIFLGKLIFLAVWQGDFYQLRAEANAGKEIHIAAARGIIYDRFGRILVENQPTFSVAAKPRNINEVAEVLGLAPEEIKSQLKAADLNKASSLVIARDVAPEKIVQLKSLESEDVEVFNDYKRAYRGRAFSHILGYTGFGKTNEVVGKTGLEYQYDEYLKGKPGAMVIYRDALFHDLDKKLINNPENGKQLHLNIDGDLQEYFYNRLVSALASLGREGGAGIALNPQNGEVLALLSFPSFDGNLFVASGRNDEKTRVLNSSGRPLFNRAISGIYNPGSTIKPLMAIAALKENIIKPEKKIFSAGFIEIPNPYFPDQPSRFLDWKAHGWVDVYSALARSSNVYFYTIGGGFGDVRGLGIEKIKEYWKKFNFDKKTGIDLPSEAEGFLPDPAEKENRTGDIWRLGDTYNVSIGQGDFLVTPIELLNQISAIANGGKLYRPFIVKSIKDANGNIVKENQPEILADYSLELSSEIKEVQIGMEDAVRQYYGTAHLLSDLPFKVAGKTGSAQIANNTKTNAFFVGYAPAQNPQIAILVLVENAREGSLNAVPVARDVLEWYYYNRILK
jgi:penicillin-binding protein 2